MCSIAAIITLGRMNGAIATVGDGYELDAIASVAIGGASMSGGKGKMWGTFIGAMILQVIRNGMNFLQVSPYYQKMVIGFVITSYSIHYTKLYDCRADQKFRHSV